jgi:hypothetical protein
MGGWKPHEDPGRRADEAPEANPQVGGIRYVREVAGSNFVKRTPAKGSVDHLHLALTTSG